eukprot:TRINITY_DN6763_c0_g1_i1.p1 TRINITY_DN6763_c0_g1~~TRINITY_DN6763_c0_g1_i1.p1  ORF type:complete len:471 (-),score=94.23 TRINITY_DN6763_c0_g1_i1:101-1471(-)
MAVFKPQGAALEVDSATKEPDDYTVENTSLDLDAISQSYSGLMKIKRLLHIARHCPMLALDATQHAVEEVRSTFNIGAFQDICYIRHQLTKDPKDSPTSPEAISWIDDRKRQSSLILETLDKDLKSFRSHSIKESIRRGYDDLGDHYLKCGDLTNSFKCYSRAKDYCLSDKHFYGLYLNIIVVSVFVGNWSTVINYYNKADSYGIISNKQLAKQTDMLKIKSRLLAAVGLAEMCLEKYKNAARYFLQLSIDAFDFPEILSAHDVAIYAGLCALATYDRPDLNSKVISSNTFKEFLELEPTLRNAICQFYDSKYTACLGSLRSIQGDLLLDPFLAPHVNKLLWEIRRRALVQYFTPYSSVDMNKMAESFESTIGELEKEISSLILEGKIQGRIDANAKILYSRSVDPRMLSFKHVLEAGRTYKQQTTYLLLRANMMKQKVSVGQLMYGSYEQEVDYL